MGGRHGLGDQSAVQGESKKKVKMDLKCLSWEIGVSLTKGIWREAGLEEKE